MGVPKRRVSTTRKRERRSHHALTVPSLEACSHCHQPKRPHRACPNCGYYGGRPESIVLSSRAIREDLMKICFFHLE